MKKIKRLTKLAYSFDMTLAFIFDESGVVERINITDANSDSFISVWLDLKNADYIGYYNDEIGSNLQPIGSISFNLMTLLSRIHMIYNKGEKPNEKEKN